MPTLSGLLNKQGAGARSAWLPRYFVLSNGTLSYFTNQTDATAKGSIEINEAVFVKDAVWRNAYTVIQRGTRVLVSLLDSLMFGWVPKNAASGN